MRVSIFLGLFFLLSGCVTNQLHFSPYTADSELVAIKNKKINSSIIGVSSVERCSQCSESSKVVWHAANYNGGLYEGFASVPVTDWIDFTKRAIGSDDDAKIKTRVEINRIFVKTWNSPDYYACEASVSVYVEGAKYVGESRVKLKGSGQAMVAQDLAYLKAEALHVVSLALKAAYMEALGSREKTRINN